MKRIFLYLFIPLFFLTDESFAHNWGKAYDWCPPIRRRFVANAAVSTFEYWLTGYHYGSGQYFAYNYPYYYQHLDTDKGCTRPREAYKEISRYYSSSVLGGPGWFIANAGWRLDFTHAPDFDGYQWAHYTNDARLQPRSPMGIMVDTAKLAVLDKSGFSYANISADIHYYTLTSQLNVCHFAGDISIFPNSNYYSTLKILVLKEKLDLTQEESDRIDSLSSLLIFENVVLSGGLTLTKDGLDVEGFLTEYISSGDVSLITDTAYGLSLNDLSMSINNSISLADDEILTIVTYSDGGFNFDLARPDWAIENDINFAGLKNFEVTDGTEIYPNPAGTKVSININSLRQAELAKITICDITGKIVRTIFEGEISSNLILNDIDVAELINGVYFVKIIRGNESSVHKLVISK